MLLMQDEDRSSTKKPRRRKKHQRSRIQHELKQMMQAQPHVTVLGEDLLFRALLKDFGGEPPATVPFQILYNDTPLTVVAVPDRLWVKPPAMASLEHVRNRMQVFGRRCIMLPQSALRPMNLGPDGIAGLLHLMVNEVGFIYDLACPPGRRHDPAGCFAHLVMRGAPCPAH